MTSGRSPGLVSTRQSSAGFTLIEVMVALVLLAGGLLSVAYMQTYSLQFGQESYHRGQTLVSVNKLIDSMRSMQIASNSAGGVSAGYTDISGIEPDTDCDFTSATPGNDLACFYQELEQTLPYGTATVAVNPTDNNYFDITVYWSDRGLSEQAGFSNPDIDEDSVNLTDPADCNAASNRVWSADNDIIWPRDNAPATAICLVSHTYSVQILDTSTL